MADIGVFVERYTITRSEEMNALMRLGQAARKRGHSMDYLFRPDIYRIPQYDAIFIRALTDPLNSTYIVSRYAELHGKRVVDDSRSIYICCDKVNMYRHLQQGGIPIPETVYLHESDLTEERGAELFEYLGRPFVIKAPNSSFSLYVERVADEKEYVKLGNRYLRRADRFLAQRFVPSEFDWRVTILAGEVLSVCRYTIPKKRWKILTYVANGRTIYGPVKGMDIDRAEPALLELAIKAGKVIGNGFYGVDLKQVGNEFVVIEVNDNPTVAAGEEDQKAPLIYERIIQYLAGDWD